MIPHDSAVPLLLLPFDSQATRADRVLPLLPQTEFPGLAQPSPLFIRNVTLMFSMNALSGLSSNHSPSLNTRKGTVQSFNVCPPALANISTDV